MNALLHPRSWLRLMKGFGSRRILVLRLLAISALVATLLAPAVPAAAQGFFATTTVIPPAQTANVGDSVSVDIFVQHGSIVSHRYDWNLGFDPAILQVTSVTLFGFTFDYNSPLEKTVDKLLIHGILQHFCFCLAWTSAIYQNIIF